MSSNLLTTVTHEAGLPLLNALPPVEGEVQSSVIEALRRATTERHRMVEAQLQLDAEFGIGHYRGTLQCFEAFLVRWEASIAASLPPRLQRWFSERQRLPLLRRDLAALSTPPLALLDNTFELALPNLAAAFGSLYVMEGSALGGKVIAHQLARQHGIGAENGGAYFWGSGEVTAAKWREFRLLLEQEVGPGAASRAHACTAAVQTFDALIMTLRRSMHEPAAT
jgi:heme oxygenase (biliverdin-IX-beta and delta-forming)